MQDTIHFSGKKASFQKRLASMARNFVALKCKTHRAMQDAFPRRKKACFSKASCIFRQRFQQLHTKCKTLRHFYSPAQSIYMRAYAPVWGASFCPSNGKASCIFPKGAR